MPRADRRPGRGPSRRRWARATLRGTACVLVLLASRAHAAGPLIVNSSGAPLTWSGGVVDWNPDRGTLGTLSNAAATALVGNNFAKWQAVPTAALSITNGGQLPVDVTTANVNSFLGVCGDGVSPIVFDTDGSITDALLGSGASNSILGFAGPECGTLSPPTITEASAVLNGKFIDGIQTGNNPEITVAEFGAVFLHEFGHYLDLDHSQINLVEAFDGNPGNDDAIATMFPILVNGTEAATLARDDEVSISTLYPTAAFTNSFGRITGQILRSDGVTPFQGAYVIARNVADPRHDAIGYASGTLDTGAVPALHGSFQLPGLVAGASYTVEVEAIYPGFSGGSGVGPFSTPVVLPGPPEFWSGAGEAGGNPPDDPNAPGTAIVATAGQTTTSVDIILNAPVRPVNDDCSAATVVDPLPFADSIATDGATSEATDPVQTCGATQHANANSVWYRLVAPGTGTVTVSTAGSTYDTVLSAYTGACGSLAPVACSDDVNGGLQSAIGFAVSAGTTYLLEATQFGSPGGGTLALTVSFTPGTAGSCELPAPGACAPGAGKPSTDCVSEWLVEPVPPIQRANVPRRNVPGTKLVCHDGDPSCDFDGVKGDGCTFHVAVCVNNADPRVAVAGCAPSAIASFQVQRPSSTRPKDAADAANAATLKSAVASLVASGATIAGAVVSFSPPDASVSACTPFQDIRVPGGTRVLRIRATTPAGVADSDHLTLRCQPPAALSRRRR